MEEGINGFIEHDGERTDLKGCKKIIAVTIADDGVHGIAYGEFDLIEKAAILCAFNKVMEEAVESTPGLREAIKLIEVIYNEAQD